MPLNFDNILRILLFSIELAACVFSLIYFIKNPKSKQKYFLYVLLIVCINESVGWWILFHPAYIKYSTSFFFYFGTPLKTIAFFSFIIYTLGKDIDLKILGVISLLLYIISWYIDFLYLKPVNHQWFYYFSFSIASMGFTLMVIVFFLKYTFSEKIIGYKNDFAFWFYLGLGIYFIGTLPFFSLRNYLLNHHYSIFIVYWRIQMLLNCMMYLSIIIAFRCRKKI